MNPRSSSPAILRLHSFPALLRRLAALGCVLITASAYAQITGTVEGRVYNPANGEYLERARITVEGTTLETFTDADGNYRLTNVPVGTAKVRAFFTGFAAQTNAVQVAAGQSVRHDISLSPFQKKPDGTADPGVVQLDPFAVNVAREMTGTAYAINEQRFAPNRKNVVSTEEFGNVAEGNAGEFLKFLPGVTVDYTAGGNASEISINGVPADYVPITVDGFSLAGAGTGNSTRRAVEIDMVSINNMSRIEVTYSPTPESKGSALAGSVNMVQRSSFERSRPEFKYTVFMMMRDNNRDFNKTPGPHPEPSRKVFPGFDFTYVVPVNKRFGFTLSGGHSKQYSEEPFISNSWRGAALATNGPTGTFPDTTPDKPYLTSIRIRDGGKETTRSSAAFTVDYKFSAYDRVSLGFQYNWNHLYTTNHSITFNVNRVLPGSFSPTHTHGAVGAGDLVGASFSRVQPNLNYMPTLVWRHDGPVWKADAGAGMSRASNHDRDMDKGLFKTNVRRTGVTVSFDDIFYLGPRQITVTDGATGQPINPYDLANYALISGTSTQQDSIDIQRSVYGNLRRDFYGRVPVSLKGGFNLHNGIRDLRRITPAYNYVGRDGRGSTTPVGSDDSAAPFVDPTLLQRPGPWGAPPPGVPRQGPAHVFQFWQANPNPNQFTTNVNNTFRSEVAGSKHTDETVSAAYLRSDVSFFERRLKLVGGMRAEQTNVKAEGPLTDPTRNIQRDASGNPLRGPTGAPLPITTDALETSRLTFIDRGTKVDKEYLRFFPSLNASYNLRENLIVRAAVYRSVGRPNLNQYSGGITLPNLENPPSTSNRITVNNAGIKAWSANTAQLRFEYYFEGIGQISIGGFRREFKNFFGSIVTRVTPEFLALYGLEAEDYDQFDVSTQQNVEGIVRMQGLDMNYKQALTFLPRWARGVQVFANASAQRATGEASNNFAGYIPRSGSWGVSFTREKYNARVNWNYRGRQRRALVATGPSIEPATYNWGSKRMYIDVLGEYYFRKRFAVYANFRNIGAAPEDFEIHGPSTPPHAQFSQRVDYGSLWVFGVKGSF
ncbi:MAG: carboxypeptidase regulatory-like domain-containing protein [Opitutaceae bacterium]|nr:carboxypeptidase regulatory-like domain-containing protein [Opitutaceae bacterium]